MTLRRIYDDHLFPRLVDLTLTDPLVGSWRRAACAGLGGDVVEFGFGSGRNLPHYPGRVRTVAAVEPSDTAWKQADGRIGEFARRGGRVQRVGLDAARLDLPDGSADAVVSTWTLCSIADLGAALREARRVLRPGGQLRYVEHSLAPDASVAQWQRRLQPAWGHVAGGCHLDRDIPALLIDAGFRLTDTRERYVSAVPGSRVVGWFVTGAALPSAAPASGSRAWQDGREGGTEPAAG